MPQDQKLFNTIFPPLKGSTQNDTLDEDEHSLLHGW